MPTPVLQEIESVSADLVERIGTSSPGSGAIWQIDGPPSAGKTSCLRAIDRRLKEDDRFVPVLVSPPAHHLDAAPAALANVAVELASANLVNGDASSWVEKTGRWEQRVQDVRRWLTDHEREVVLLLDEPMFWGANRAGDDFFSKRAFEAAFTMAAVPCRRVVAGRLPVPITPQARVDLGVSAGGQKWLTDASEWGALGGAVSEVSASKLFNLQLTPLQVRLLVGSVALTSLPEVQEKLTGKRDGRALVGLFAGLVRGKAERVWKSWLRLSLTRGPFDAELLGELCPAGLTRLERDLVQHCLVFGDGELRMQNQLRVYGSRWRREHAADTKRLAGSANRTLFKWHAARFNAFVKEGDSRAINESIESFHFAAATGDSSLIGETTPIFVDQLDALGWSLSYEHGKYGRAAKAFQQAFQWDENDDYAHHYFAYNLDRLGRHVDDVEAHYRRAVDLNGSHSWWRSRLVTFLLTRGRVDEARLEWDEALAELGVGEGDAAPETFESLYCWVAGALLDIGEVKWAREALDEVPDWARGQIEIYRPLSVRADALLEAGTAGAVVPAWRLRSGWWELGPELLQHRLGTGERLYRWLAARLERRDEDGLHFRAAVLDIPQEGLPEYAWTKLSLEDFDALCRDEVSSRDLNVGAFLEIGIYAGDAGEKGPVQTMIRVLDARHLSPSGLPHFYRDRFLDSELQVR